MTQKDFTNLIYTEFSLNTGHYSLDNYIQQYTVSRAPQVIYILGKAIDEAKKQEDNIARIDKREIKQVLSLGMDELRKIFDTMESAHLVTKPIKFNSRDELVISINWSKLIEIFDNY